MAARAAASGDVAALRRLEAAGRLAAEGEEGEDRGAPDEPANTPLVWAADAGQAAAVEYLLGLEATDVNHRGYLGATALCRACRRGHCDVLRLLLGRPEADPNIPNLKAQHPLHFAAFKKNAAAVAVLLLEDPAGRASTTVVDRKGRTPAEDTSVEGIREAVYAARRGDAAAAEAWLRPLLG